MNVNIIPSPKKLLYSQISEKIIPSVLNVYGEYGEGLKRAITLLTGNYEIKKDGNIEIFIGRENFTDEIASECKGLFSEKYSDKQGYYLKKRGSRIIVCSLSELGAMYALMSLIQVCDNGYIPNELLIYDYPDFLYRANKWLSWAECGVWSYDRGDGIEAYTNRIFNKLDMCLKYKINTVLLEAFGWRSERFPGYGEMMRKINRRARSLGIHIMNNGYGMGYGMIGHGRGIYQGDAHYNRKSYPDGEVYDCIGTYDFGKPEDFVRGRIYGTCLSNDDLMNEKLDEICGFLKNTEMGALMIHNMDSDYILEPLWKARCDQCREKWPSDSLFDEDGAAGAFAYFIDRLYKGITSVKTKHYDAKKDCIVYIISPGYMYMHEKDEYFEIALKFWQSVTDLLPSYENLYIGFREHYMMHGNNELRFDKLKKNIKNCGVACFDFCGGDGYYSDKLFVGGGLFLKLMRGADAMIMENGNSNQEPMQLYNAEYLWNSEASSFYNIDNFPKKYDDFEPFYIDHLKGKTRHEEIYGDGGMLEVICEKLYGKKAAKDFSNLYKISDKNGEPPLVSASSSEIFTHYTKAAFPMRWDNDLLLENEGKINIDMLVERFDNINFSTTEALNLIKRIYDEKKYFKHCEDDVRWQFDNFKIMAKFTDLLSRYMSCYKIVNAYFLRGTAISEEVKRNIEIIKKEADNLLSTIKSSNLKPICHLDGAIARREELADFISYNAEIMMRSIVENSRIPSNLRPVKTRDHW